MYLRQILFAERTVWIVVHAALQTLEAERVTAGSGDWLIKQSGGMGEKKGKESLNSAKLRHYLLALILE